MFEWMAVLAWFGLGGAATVELVRGRRRRAGILAAGLALLTALLAFAYRSDLAMQKGISHLVMPFGIAWLASFGLTAALFAAGQRIFAGWALALFLLQTLGGNDWVGTRAIAALESSVDSKDLADAPDLDALLVLGGGAGFGPRGEPALGDFGDRVIVGARMYLHGKTDVLVASGSAIEALHGTNDLVDATARIWIDLGIPNERIERLTAPKNTSQEIEAFAALVKERGWKRVGVLTSAWHLRRAMALAKARGLEAVAIAADRRSGTSEAHPAMLIPRPEAWRWTQRAAWELLGAMVGR